MLFARISAREAAAGASLGGRVPWGRGNAPTQRGRPEICRLSGARPAAIFDGAWAPLGGRDPKGRSNTPAKRGRDWRAWST